MNSGRSEGAAIPEQSSKTTLRSWTILGPVVQAPAGIG